VLFGLGMVAGNLVGGRFADRHLMPMLLTALAALGAVLAAFTLTAHDKTAAAVTVFLIGALGFATVPPLQKRVLDQAAGAPTLASALNIGAFNLGNALAAWLGGLVISAGHSYTAANWVGAALTGAALVLAAVSAALERAGRRSAAAPQARTVLGRTVPGPAAESGRGPAAESGQRPVRAETSSDSAVEWAANPNAR
jgi:DHA1 family inner membrane transport protein